MRGEDKEWNSPDLRGKDSSLSSPWAIGWVVVLQAALRVLHVLPTLSIYPLCGLCGQLEVSPISM